MLGSNGVKERIDGIGRTKRADMRMRRLQTANSDSIELIYSIGRSVDI